MGRGGPGGGTARGFARGWRWNAVGTVLGRRGVFAGPTLGQHRVGDGFAPDTSGSLLGPCLVRTRSALGICWIRARPKADSQREGAGRLRGSCRNHAGMRAGLLPEACRMRGGEPLDARHRTAGRRRYDADMENATRQTDTTPRRASLVTKVTRLASEALLETLWPTRCAVCDEPGELLCGPCRLGLPYTDWWRACPAAERRSAGCNAANAIP